MSCIDESFPASLLSAFPVVPCFTKFLKKPIPEVGDGLELVVEHPSRLQIEAAAGSIETFILIPGFGAAAVTTIAVIVS